jgi:hypothetical protein
MRVLIACEFSGIVREAFRARGHEAWSCDLLPSEQPSGFHFEGDIWPAIELMKWDLMIAHPPCTFLTDSGNRWFKSDPDRMDKMLHAVRFVKDLWHAPIERICIENPIGRLPRQWRMWDQKIHPWQFGHREPKPTCLWLKNLPRLKPTNIIPESPICVCGGRRDMHPNASCKRFQSSTRITRIHREPPGPDRWKNRSRTYQGIADAMAEQWGSVNGD